mgnify:CR=1 FL=1
MLNIQIDKLACRQTLANDWQRLEQTCPQTDFFLSWPWISSWLACHVTSAKVLKVYACNKLVGLALICTKQHKNLSEGFGQTDYLNKTGITELDEIWIEYNQALIQPKYESEAHQAIIDRLLAQKGINRVEIGVSLRQKLDNINCRLKKITWQQPSYSVTLSKWRTHNNSLRYAEYLSKNFRKQIKRSEKGFNQIGKLQLDSANTLEDKLSYFSSIGKLHQLKWKDKNKGFNNPDFVSFHHYLITHYTDFCQFIRIRSGETVIGYLYIFIYRATAYFYLSGLQNFEDNKLKAGITSHFLAIQHYAESGFEKYDFMAGQARYKKSFSDQITIMQTAQFLKPNLLNRLFFTAYKIKHKFKRTNS